MEPASEEPARPGFAARPWVWAFLVGVVFLTLIPPFLRFEPAPPPVLYPLPDFELVTASGEPFSSTELLGRPWIASFFFTRCPSICPTLMRSMNVLRSRMDEAGLDGVQFVSVTVDPANDDPVTLRAYAKKHALAAGNWTFLTGEPDAVHDVAESAFRVPMGRPEDGDAQGPYDIVHTGKLVLVDAQGRIRGYYDSTPEGLDETFHRTRRVAEEADAGA